MPVRPAPADAAKAPQAAHRSAVDRPRPPRAVPPVVARKKPETPSLLPDPEPPKAPAQRKPGTFTLPPLALLDAPKAERKIDERELMDLARQLEEKCREFSVEGQVAQIHPGPVVTTFEFKPEAGVKYSKITGPRRRPVPGDAGRVGAHRPHPGQVHGRHPDPEPAPRGDLAARAARVRRRTSALPSKLTLALGKTIHGEPYYADLATMPHLLIAGSTGTGKSVGLNAMLTSILYRATPDDVRMIMIDPKRLELGMYDDIPHLLTPVVVDPKKAANALRWAVREMEERYKTLAAEGVRNIEQYNRNIRAGAGRSAARQRHDPEAPKPLPFIVVVIDELADLMMVASNEVEESICRLAQMARAVGIHLILATQRPSVDVITGLIKANLPSRISFRVSSKTDSRTILDGNGAEQLLGKGDMLFLPPASSRCIRLHGPYISEQESARLASFLRKQGKPVFDDTITAEDEEKSGPAAWSSRRTSSTTRPRASWSKQRPGVDLLPAAQAAHRLQPRCSARGHDGGRRPRVAERRRQSPARCWCDRTTSMRSMTPSCGSAGFASRAQCLFAAHRHSARALRALGPRRAAAAVLVVAAAVASAQPSDPVRLHGEAMARETALRADLSNPAARDAVPPSAGCARWWAPSTTWRGSSRPAAQATRRCGRAACWPPMFWQWGDPVDRATRASCLSRHCGRLSRSARYAPVAGARQASRRHASGRGGLGPCAGEQPAVPAPPAAAPPALAPSAASPIGPDHSTRASAGVAACRAASGAPATALSDRDSARGPGRRRARDAGARPRDRFHSERIPGSLAGVRGSAAARARGPQLRDAVLPFPDGVVQRIRVGRHPGGITRVVLDLTTAGRHSVYTLYNPYRIVIDVERARPDGPRAVAHACRPRPASRRGPRCRGRWPRRWPSAGADGGAARQRASRSRDWPPPPAVASGRRRAVSGLAIATAAAASVAAPALPPPVAPAADGPRRLLAVAPARARASRAS